MTATQYLRPQTLAEVQACLQQHPNAQLLAGGQSLLAAMRLGLSQPSHWVDLQDVAQLQDIRLEADHLWIGAMVTHARIAAHAGIQQHHPMLARLAHGIADQQVRNVGTLGGSLANNDPAACWPAGVLAYGATLVTPRREVPADAFFTDLFTTALAREEVLLGVRFPNWSCAQYLKHEQAASRFAMVGVAVTRNPAPAQVRVTITGLGNGVLRWHAAESALQQRWSVHALDGLTLDEHWAQGDVHASASYRAHLAAVLCRRAVALDTHESAHMPRVLPTRSQADLSPIAPRTSASHDDLAIAGSHPLPQPVAVVWHALLDPTVLQQCIPGCVSIQRLDDTHYTAVVKVGLGPVSARFDTHITLTPVRTPEQGEPTQCHLQLIGHAGALGQAQARVVVHLYTELSAAGAPGTRLDWSATPQLSGALAQLGNRLLQASARSLSQQFFARLTQVIGGASPAPVSPHFFYACWSRLCHGLQRLFQR